MKSCTFTDTITLNDEQFAMLTKISEVNYLFNFDGPDEQLDLCDSLVSKGLCFEDRDGRVSISNRGRRFLLECK